MNFKMTFSDFKDIAEHLLNKANQNAITFELDHNETTLRVKFVDKMDDQCIITIFSARSDIESNKFPTLTKTGRLNDEL